MYTVSVEATFCATHQVRLPDGSLEPLHGHDWCVQARFASKSLSEDGMVVDFVAVEGKLAEIVGEFHHRNLNELPEFADRIPTAEYVARVIFDKLVGGGYESVSRVDVTEAPGCVATFSRDN